MIEEILSNGGLQIVWTTMWRNSYGRLFEAVPSPEAPVEQYEAGLDSPNNAPANDMQLGVLAQNVSNLVFRFAPDLRRIVSPAPASVPVGSDGWAMGQGYVSVTPLRASLAEPSILLEGNGERAWKIKL
jgi:hypothetical protein